MSSLSSYRCGSPCSVSNTLIAIALTLLFALSGCGGGGSASDQDNLGNSSNPPRQENTGGNNDAVPTEQFAAPFTPESAKAVGNSSNGLLVDIMRIARGGMLLEGKLRQAAYPSARFTKQSTLADVSKNLSYTPSGSYDGCPTVTLPDVLSSKGFAITIDYRVGCIDTLDGVSRSGKVLINVSNIDSDLASNQLLSATADVSFDSYTVADKKITGSAKIMISSAIEEQWVIDLTASSESQQESINFTARVTTTDTVSDIETITGSGVYINPAQEKAKLVFDALQYDLDNHFSSLVCSYPIGGTLTLEGATKVVLNFPVPDCGYANLTLNNADPHRIAMTNGTPDLVVENSYSSPWITTIGSSLTGSLQISNRGTVAAHGVTLTVKTVGIELPTFHYSDEYCPFDNGLVCTIQTIINPGESVSLNFSDRPTKIGTSQVEAIVTHSLPDANAANDTVKVLVVVNDDIYIHPEQPITSIQIQSPAISLAIGNFKSVTATAYLDKSPMHNQPFTWTSSHPEIATVNDNGTITAIASGTAQITATSGGITSAPLEITVTTDQIRKLALLANDIIYDPHSAKLYASVPSAAGILGNSITIIDPVTAQIEHSVFIGSEPGKMALSDDGQYIYVALNGSSYVRRFDVTTQSVGPQFDVRYNGDTSLVTDLEVMPGQPTTVVAARRGVIAVYDEGIQRSNQTTEGNNVYIEFGDNSNTLYSGSEYGGMFWSYFIDSSGIAAIGSASCCNTNIYNFTYSNGLIYSNTGKIYNPSGMSVAGTLLADLNNSITRPDPTSQRAYMFGRENRDPYPHVIQSFDINTYLPMERLEISFLSASDHYYYQATDLIRWGEDGLVVWGNGGDVYLINAPSLVSTAQ
ncbi:MAG: hypothetical protein FD130_141 [Halothiobacillaceae bacterium]|nr:MAG: hypothetical protein FD130_141 [Halothiobacillaceae bacterium]